MMCSLLNTRVERWQQTTEIMLIIPEISKVDGWIAENVNRIERKFKQSYLGRLHISGLICYTRMTLWS